MGNVDSTAFPYTAGSEIPTFRGSKSHWTMYEGTHKTTGEPVTIFTLDKTTNSHRVEAAQNCISLLRAIRHPGIVRYVDSADLPGHIHLVTERVTPLSLPFQPPPDEDAAAEAAAAGVQRTGGMGASATATTTPAARAAAAGAALSAAGFDAGPRALPSSSPDALPQLLALGVFQIASALAFLGQAKVVHGSVNPGTVFVADSGDWKLGGFDTAFKLTFAGGAGAASPSSAAGSSSVMGSVPSLSRSLIPQTQPEPFCPPEARAQRWEELARAPLFALDSYALGGLIKELYTKPFRPPASAGGGGRSMPAGVPAGLQRVQQALCASSPSQRMDPGAVMQDPFFCAPLVSSVTFLEKIVMQSNEEKVRFFKSLPLLAGSLPRCSLRGQLLPALLKTLEFSRAGDPTFPSLLSCVLSVAATALPPSAYAAEVVPLITRLFKAPERAVRVHLLQHVGDYAPHLAPAVVQTEVLPPLLGGFRDTHPLIRELTVKALPPLSSHLPHDIVEGHVLPPLVHLLSDPNPALRAAAVAAIAGAAGALPRGARERVLLPAFSRGLKDPHPPTRAACIEGLLAASGAGVFTAETCARRVLPYTIPFTLDPSADVRRRASALCDALMARVRARVAELGEVDDPEGAAAAGTMTVGGALAPAAGVAAQPLGGHGQAGASAGAAAAAGGASAGASGSGGAGYLGAMGAWAAAAVGSKVSSAVQAALVSGMGIDTGSSSSSSSSSAAPAASRPLASSGSAAGSSSGYGSSSAAQASRPPATSAASSSGGFSGSYSTPRPAPRPAAAASGMSAASASDAFGFPSAAAAPVSAPAKTPAKKAPTFTSSAGMDDDFFGSLSSPAQASSSSATAKGNAWGEVDAFAGLSAPPSSGSMGMSAGMGAGPSSNDPWGSLSPPPSSAPAPAPAPAPAAAQFDAFGFPSSPPPASTAAAAAPAPAAAVGGGAGKQDDWDNFF